jgi:RNA polymerase sigma-70 factor, ECF subfamily
MEGPESAHRSTDSARLAADRAARTSYGRLLARIVARSGDIASAEDALSDAFDAALTTWPSSGVPEAPEAWLLSVARRKLVDKARHAAIRQRPDVLAALVAAEEDQMNEPDRLPDDRIRLMLVCTHPAIDASIRPALMLQTVLGVEAAAMAPLFLVSSETMTKRLVRAKAKIRDAGLRFEAPDVRPVPERVHAVVEAIYGAYVLGAEGAIADGDTHDDLRREAVYLGEVVAQSLPDHAEALGFLALLRFCEARRPAQVDAVGAFVPILKQDPGAWNPTLMRRGYELLERAAQKSEPGPFQLEAAIHGAHCYRARSGVVPWAEIAHLYEVLVERYPSIGARVGLAVATAHARSSPTAGLSALLAMDGGLVQRHQPWWAALGYLHERAGNHAESHQCLVQALALTHHPRLQAYFRSELAKLEAPKTTAAQSG